MHPCTVCPCTHAQVAVALMRKMNIGFFGSADQAAANMAEALHNTWGVGLKECDNGVLLLLAVDDRQMYISRGKGAASRLRDDVIDRIIENARPLLRSQRYATSHPPLPSTPRKASIRIFPPPHSPALPETETLDCFSSTPPRLLARSRSPRAGTKPPSRARSWTSEWRLPKSPWRATTTP
jgi:hypothetical protein